MLTFLGAAAGVILGKVLTLFIIETVEVDAAMFGRVINISSFVYSLLFTIAFSIIINGIMYFKLKKIDMVESLKSIE
jgi:putative ABC transport system permease protein